MVYKLTDIILNSYEIIIIKPKEKHYQCLVHNMNYTKAQQKGIYRTIKATEYGIYKMFRIWEWMVT